MVAVNPSAGRVEATKVLGQGVTVRAQDFQVDALVVERVPVDVIDLQGRATSKGVDPTPATAPALEVGFEEKEVADSLTETVRTVAVPLASQPSSNPLARLAARGALSAPLGVARDAGAAVQARPRTPRQLTLTLGLLSVVGRR